MDALQDLWKQRPFSEAVTQRLKARTGEDGICRIRTVSLGGGPGSDLYGFVAFLAGIRGDLGQHGIQTILLEKHTIVDTGRAWAALGYLEQPHVQHLACQTCLAYIINDATTYPITDGWGDEDVDWNEMMTYNALNCADVVLASHVLVDFPPEDREAYFQQMLGNAMAPGALFVALDRFTPRCMEHLLGAPGVTAAAIPGTKSGQAVAAVASEDWLPAEDAFVAQLAQLRL